MLGKTSDLTAAGESGQLDARLGRGSGGETGRSGELWRTNQRHCEKRDELGRLYQRRTEHHHQWRRADHRCHRLA